MNAEQFAFLIELMQTKGLMFPTDKCKLVYQTQEALVVEWQRAVELEKADNDPRGRGDPRE